VLDGEVFEIPGAELEELGFYNLQRGAYFDKVTSAASVGVQSHSSLPETYLTPRVTQTSIQGPAVAVFLALFERASAAGKAETLVLSSNRGISAGTVHAAEQAISEWEAGRAASDAPMRTKVTLFEDIMCNTTQASPKPRLFSNSAQHSLW